MKNLLVAFLILPLFVAAQTKPTPEDIVEQIKRNVTCDWVTKTVDTFKAGNPKSEVKGIAVCMFADMNTLKKAVERDCNFIITHEPVFYNHLDETLAFENDKIYQTKRKFIDDNKLVIFRFHDHIHRTSPDGIYEGMLNKLNWEKFALKNSQSFFEFPETSLKQLTVELKEKLNLETIRVIGNPDMKFTKLGLAVGAPGGGRHIKMLSDNNIEVLVAGEAPEWETYAYANDALTQGQNKAVVFLGHIKSEEAGMEYCAGWLRGFIKDTPVHFIENDNNFIEM